MVRAKKPTELLNSVAKGSKKPEFKSEEPKVRSNKTVVLSDKSEAVSDKTVEQSNKINVKLENRKVPLKNPSVLFVSSECAPFAKVGGLADVVGSLPKVLKEQGCDVRVIMPFYRKIKQKHLESAVLLRWAMIKLGWRTQYSGLYTMNYEGIQYYFIDNEYFFGHDKVYIDYTFDIERFCFFQRAVLEALGEPMNFEPDILHCNDWQAGMIPCLLYYHYKTSGYHLNMKTVLTIHNLKYQGIHSKEMISDLLDLPHECINENGILHRGDPNFLKAGIVYSDAITTVSETYAKEILTTEYGEGLDGILREKINKIYGIVNGIDTFEYNPENDTALPEKYNIETVFKNKPICKKGLQKELNLSQSPQIPLLGMVTRLVDQKGLDLILYVLDEILDTSAQVAILGTGDPYYENALTDISLKRKDCLSASITFDNQLAHRIYAGCDMFIMPSLFEPCGLSQMISMHYGTIPIVRETGGLKDTVIPYNEFTGEGTGFSFINPNPNEFLKITKYACDVFENKKDAWKWLIRNGMSSNFTWSNSAKKYLELYKEIL